MMFLRHPRHRHRHGRHHHGERALSELTFDVFSSQVIEYLGISQVQSEPGLALVDNPYSMFLRKRAVFSLRNEFGYLDIARPLGGGYIHLYMISLALTPAAPSQTIRAIQSPAYFTFFAISPLLLLV